MNTAVTVFFLILRVFSLYFLAVSLFGLCSRRRPEPAARLRRFAVLIAARNEECCIAGLIESLRAQHYPPELVDIWVLPNNCTDRTAEAARRAGAQVLEMPASVRSKGAALHTANTAVTVFFLILRVFSLYFLAVSLFGLCSRRRPEPAARLRRFAVLIAARNEECCIAGLIESLRAQHYPPELVDIWVLPNNCTDRTAEAARRAGAQVLEMPASVRSKGAALHTAAKALLRSARNYDAFCVFDADNEADPAFLSEMNRALDRTAIVKSRILAKNRTQAGISACYEIYFCSANHFLNRAREAVGLSARVIGTGFAIRRDLLEGLGGFPCRTLTEDAELYAACLCRGARIGYCETAVTYDEEPVTWRASLVQRRRWMSGILQVARLTLPELLANFLRQPSLNCLDGLLQLSFPFLQALTPFFALEALLAGSMSLQGLPVSLLTAYAGCLAAAVAALALERRLDRKLVGGMLLYPVFMACFLPLQTLALFKTQTIWHEIRHSGVRLAAEVDLRRGKIA